MTERNRLAGHALAFKGAAHDDHGQRASEGTFLLKTTGLGRAKCSCGELSPPLPSATRRKAWHRQHKAAAIAATKDQL